LAGALVYTRRSLTAFSELAKRFPDDDEIQFSLSQADTQVGFELSSLADPEAAVSHYERMVALREALVRRHPNDFVYRRALMLGYEHLAAIHGSALSPNLGHTELARRYYDKARPLFEEAYAADPENTKFYYADFLMRSAALDVPPGQLTKSLRTLRKAADLLEGSRTVDPAALRYPRTLAIAREYIGHRLLALSRPTDALAEYHRSLTLAATILVEHPDNRPDLGQALSSERALVHMAMRSDNRRLALEHARKLLARAEAGARFPSDQPVRQSFLAEAYLTLAQVHHKFNQVDAMRKAAERAASLARPLLTHRVYDPAARILREAQGLALSAQAVNEPVHAVETARQFGH